MLYAFSDSISHQLARTITGSHHRIPFFLGKQHQSAGLCDFYHGQLIMQQIFGSDRSHQWIAYRYFNQLATDSRMKGLHEALTTIADRHLYNFCIRVTASDTLCCCLICLFRGQATLE